MTTSRGSPAATGCPPCSPASTPPRRAGLDPAQDQRRAHARHPRRRGRPARVVAQQRRAGCASSSRCRSTPTRQWARDNMVDAAELLDVLGSRFALTAAAPRRPVGPAEEWLVDGGPATVGIIASVTRSFCDGVRPHPHHRRGHRALLPVRRRRDRPARLCCAAAPTTRPSPTGGARRCGASRPGTAWSAPTSCARCAAWGRSVAEALIRLLRRGGGGRGRASEEQLAGRADGRRAARRARRAVRRRDGAGAGIRFVPRRRRRQSRRRPCRSAPRRRAAALRWRLAAAGALLGPTHSVAPSARCWRFQIGTLVLDQRRPARRRRRRPRRGAGRRPRRRARCRRRRATRCGARRRRAGRSRAATVAQHSLRGSARRPGAPRSRARSPLRRGRGRG